MTSNVILFSENAEAELKLESSDSVEPGWYYVDETSDICGPFETEAAAYSAMEEHYEFLSYAYTMRCGGL